ncbi:hypothetical protein [Rhizobium redzepovicii]
MGGGAAGIAAAGRLAASGVSTIMLEASNRVGGAPGPRNSQALRSIWAADGCTRPTAIPGRASPTRQALWSMSGRPHGAGDMPISAFLRNSRPLSAMRSMLGKAVTAHRHDERLAPGCPCARG